MRRRFLIISGGSLTPAFAVAYHQNNDWTGIIAADSGLQICHEAGIKPDQIVGDFDSLHDMQGEWILQSYLKQGVSVHRFKPEKDLTDTQIAVELALQLSKEPGPERKECSSDDKTDLMREAADEPDTEIHVLGGTGTRLDHVLGNLQVMELALRRGASMVLADPHNRIRMYDHSFMIMGKEQWGDFISLIPWAGEVRNLTLRGFKYPLRDATLLTGQSLGISNELIGEKGEVSFTGGMLLMAETKDRC